MELVYKHSEDLTVVDTSALCDFEVTEAEELLVFQCPITQFNDWNNVGVMVSKDMISGRFENQSGKEVELVSSGPQNATAVVIIPSEEGVTHATKVVRQVSLVRYPDPNELLDTMKAKTRQKLVGAATESSGKKSDPSQSSWHRSGSVFTRSSRQKSVFSGHTETPKSKSSKRKHSEKSSKRKHSESSSGKHWSSTSTVSGSAEGSGKSKKKPKKEE